MKNRIQKGSAIYLAVVVMGVILSIVLGLGTILVSELKMSAEMGKSVVAFYAADTGIESIMSDMGDPKNSEIALNCIQASPCSLIDGEATYYVVVSARGEEECLAENYCIKSVGGHDGVSRAIEITY